MGAALALQKYPYLQCKCEECGQPMSLPTSSRLGKSPNLLSLPISHVREVLVNPLCGHVFDYTEQDVHWTRDPHVDLDRPEKPISSLVMWDCSVPNCTSRVIIQRPTGDKITPAELLKEGRDDWKFCSVHCPRGHVLTQVPDSAWVPKIELFDIAS